MAAVKRRRWLWVAGLVLLLLAGALGALQLWLGSDDLRRRVERAGAEALGVPVSMQRIGLGLWPAPAVVLEGVRIQTQPVATVERVQVRAVLAAMLRGRLELSHLHVAQADLPQAAWEQLSAQRGKRPPAASGAVPLPRTLSLAEVTWRPTRGAPLTLDVDAELAADGAPDRLEVRVREGLLAGAQLALRREALRWDLQGRVAGGRLHGPITLDRMPAPGAAVRLEGRIVTEGVDMGVLSGQRLGGRLDATTTLELRAGGPEPLLDALQTRSQFAVRGAVVRGIDLARAVRTVGLNRGGETRLDTLAGQLATRGRSLSLTQLVATSGVLSASGQVNVSASQALSGRVVVALGPAAVGQAVGVPLVVGGSLQDPALTLTRSALVGAAIGTMVMPGVGTGAGASIGEKLGNSLQGLFGK